MRASTAAPVYFDPEEITLGGKLHIFVDGAITPYNNPALIAALDGGAAFVQCELGNGCRIKFALISIGTIRVSSAAFHTKAKQMWLGYHLPRIPAALMQGVALEQDYLCRCLGECLFGETLDSEIGDMVGMSLPGENGLAM